MSTNQAIELCPELQEKYCQKCQLTKVVSEYYRNRARKDGLNKYCKACDNQAMKNCRAAKRAYREMMRTQLLANGSMMGLDPTLQLRLPRSRKNSPPKLTPVEKVRMAISAGARTQKEIAQKTGLRDEYLGEALAFLLLDTREVRTQELNNTRIYFLNHLHYNYTRN